MRYLRFKEYEVKDHLGDVRLTFSDLKISSVYDTYLYPGTTRTLSCVAYPYNIDLLTLSNYYPFGMLQPGLSYAEEKYRFGYNGKMKDDDIKGKGNSVDFGARMLDTRHKLLLRMIDTTLSKRLILAVRLLI